MHEPLRRTAAIGNIQTFKISVWLETIIMRQEVDRKFRDRK